MGFSQCFGHKNNMIANWERELVELWIFTRKSVSCRYGAERKIVSHAFRRKNESSSTSAGSIYSRLFVFDFCWYSESIRVESFPTRVFGIVFECSTRRSQFLLETWGTPKENHYRSACERNLHQHAARIFYFTDCNDFCLWHGRQMTDGKHNQKKACGLAKRGPRTRDELQVSWCFDRPDEQN